MITTTDLTDLMTDAPDLGVSLFLPTHVRGAETRQDPIRLKNLVTQAREDLQAAGLDAGEAEQFLAPASELVGERPFWQEQGEGLALFLDGDGVVVHKLPVPVAEEVTVGAGYRVRPLLPALSADGAFDVLTLTSEECHLYGASRFALEEDDASDLPGHIDTEEGESDYQNPVQASPVARPRTGSVDISNAQVYGDSPAEWSKNRVVRYADKVATAMDARSATRPVPVVVVADAEVGGHFRKFSGLGDLLVGHVEVNPQGLDRRQLHEAAYEAARPYLDAGRAAAVERLRELQGSGDARAVTDVEDVVRAAAQGRVDTLLLTPGEPVWGSYDAASDGVRTSGVDTSQRRDLLDLAATETLRNGGRVHVLDEDEADAPVAALLRY
ncbi:baeRF3 domain-containing protein [Cellulomonas phragmiteti]|uniref:Peptide chain release factor 1 n=1 Tax=Cellulomonas phragmiteti TaxID=478780 RepID=A0ABQ4DMP1_9CELL|nr:hypothetical protein [Cellulomonas phragmiteti]GIG40600.1 hypothetical protein Cph01nite_23620 [Cellulomonas phragmiteti]